MRFMRLGEPGREVPVVLDGGRRLDLRPITPDIDGDFLSADPRAAVAAAIEAGRLEELENADALRVGAPIARPSAVVCVGMNYAAHAAESGSLPPERPVIFLKTPNTVTGPFDDVVIPPGSRKTDWEVELGVVIGRRAAYLDSIEDAFAHIAGYTTVNDLSERTYQLDESGGQWSKGKCAPGFTPTGPFLVTPDEVDLTALRLTSQVNGEPRQDAETSDMIFPVARIVWELSQYLTFEPGDLILTGTPQGVALSGRFPYLAAGDVVEIEVHGVGRQRQRMQQWAAAHV